MTAETNLGQRERAGGCGPSRRQEHVRRVVGLFRVGDDLVGARLARRRASRACTRSSQPASRAGSTRSTPRRRPRRRRGSHRERDRRPLAGRLGRRTLSRDERGIERARAQPIDPQTVTDDLQLRVLGLEPRDLALLRRELLGERGGRLSLGAALLRLEPCELAALTCSAATSPGARSTDPRAGAARRSGPAPCRRPPPARPSSCTRR